MPTFEPGHRSDVLRHVKNRAGNGIELGVAQGVFSEMIFKELSPDGFYLYSVDMWAGDRGHDINEYREAVVRLDPWKRSNTILKMSFDEALPLFADNFFDFIYVDGYAHTGEGDGKYFRDWWPKLKPGGIFAGDDYHSDWPKVVQEVDRFSAEINRSITIIQNRVAGDKWAVS